MRQLVYSITSQHCLSSAFFNFFRTFWSSLKVFEKRFCRLCSSNLFSMPCIQLFVNSYFCFSKFFKLYFYINNLPPHPYYLFTDISSTTATPYRSAILRISLCRCPLLWSRIFSWHLKCFIKEYLLFFCWINPKTICYVQCFSLPDFRCFPGFPDTLFSSMLKITARGTSLTVWFSIFHINISS